MQKPNLQKYSWTIVPLLFLLYSAPVALDFVFHFPDEKYYTDAVLQMMDNGEYFTPYEADGTPRFKKPIVTYWVLIASYKLFGVSVFSLRLFFWLAGALLVGITYLMAKSITGNHKLATIASFITASNPLVLLSSSRSIPDILLVLFLTVSAWGFLEIMLADKLQKKFYWLAYLGAALAFQTKGLPAAAFAGASMLFLVLNPWKRKSVKHILEPVSVITSILVALSWFFIMYIQHGADYLSSFYTDQVGGRVSSKAGQAVTNLLLGFTNFIAFLVPWIVIVLSKPKKLKSWLTASSNKTKAIVGFVILWAVLIIALSGAVFKFYDRYLLPVFPLVSFLFAIILTSTTNRGKKTAFHIFLWLNVFLVLINICYALSIFSEPVLWVGILSASILLISWFAGFFRKTQPEILLSNSILLLFFSVIILLYPLLMPNPGKQLVKNLRNAGANGNEKIYVYGNIRTASNIRIQSHHQLNVISMDTIYQLPEQPNHFLVFDKKEQELLNLSDYKIVKGSEEWKRLPEHKFPDFLQGPIKSLKESGTKYFIAKPKAE